MKNVALHNLGCKVNSYELDVVQQMLQENGYKIVPFNQKADIYIVNTCTVTNIADRKSRQMLHRAKAKNPEAMAFFNQISGREMGPGMPMWQMISNMSIEMMMGMAGNVPEAAMKSLNKKLNQYDLVE